MEEKKTVDKKASRFAYTAILGGTHGLGAAIAQLYRSRGEPLIVMGRTITPVETSEDPKDIRIRVDLSDASSVSRAADELRAAVRVRNGMLKRFFWVAGMIIQAHFDGMELRDALRQTDVNFRNPLPIVHASWKLLLQPMNDVCRSFVVVSSTTGLATEPHPLETVYAATKAAQVSFTRALGGGLHDERAKGVRVSLFCPGGMQTDFWNATPAKDMKEYLDPTKVAQAIVDDVEKQEAPYYERTIKRGSL